MQTKNKKDLSKKIELKGGSAYANMLSRATYKGKSKNLKAAFGGVKNKVSALKLKKSPALAKLSASCKAAAKRKFKVYPSAYANMWAAKTQRQGKC